MTQARPLPCSIWLRSREATTLKEWIRLKAYLSRWVVISKDLASRPNSSVQIHSPIRKSLERWETIQISNNRETTMGRCSLVQIAADSKLDQLHNPRVATDSVVTQRRRTSLRRSYRSETRALVVVDN